MSDNGTKLKAILIDDEPNCCEILSAMLESDCPEVQVSAICNNASEGKVAILEHSPNLVFLDVEMPKMNGFEMLEQLTPIDFHLIFTTSYDQYALKAIRFSAIDYLLKPIDRVELKGAVEKVKEKIQAPIPQQLEILLQKLRQPVVMINKIALPTMEGLQLIPVESIISCESNDNYTQLQLKAGKKVMVTRSLKEMEDILEHHSFIRVHRYYMVNLNEIEKYIKGEGGYLVMSNGSSIDVAKNKKEVLLKNLLPYKK
ncbi:MAG TPA: LytTR family DNA-binding domain-containing protein [Chitinophagaceae bacterium]|nr:LytTR family DNA-binding domain-containing protein [Chitinophagaceae bacterium]